MTSKKESAPTRTSSKKNSKANSNFWQGLRHFVDGILRALPGIPYFFKYKGFTAQWHSAPEHPLFKILVSTPHNTILIM